MGVRVFADDVEDHRRAAIDTYADAQQLRVEACVMVGMSIALVADRARPVGPSARGAELMVLGALLVGVGTPAERSAVDLRDFVDQDIAHLCAIVAEIEAEGMVATEDLVMRCAAFGGLAAEPILTMAPRVQEWPAKAVTKIRELAQCRSALSALPALSQALCQGDFAAAQERARGLV